MMQYLEEFEAGQKFGSGRLLVEAARIKSFAAEFDGDEPNQPRSSTEIRAKVGWNPCHQLSHAAAELSDTTPSVEPTGPVTTF